MSKPRAAKGAGPVRQVGRTRPVASSDLKTGWLPGRFDLRGV